MDQSYIGIYDKEIEKKEYIDLKERVAQGAFRKMSGWKSDCILSAYTFICERLREGHTAYCIKGSEAKTLIQLACPPERFLDGSKKFIDSLNKIEETIAIFSTFRLSIQDANYFFDDHSATMENEVGFAYPAHFRSILQQIDDTLPDAEAALRRHLQAHFEKYGLDL